MPAIYHRTDGHSVESVLLDPTMSFRARGVLAFMVTCGDELDIESALAASNDDDEIYAAWAELTEVGRLWREHGDDGVVYHFSDAAMPGAYEKDLEFRRQRKALAVVSQERDSVDPVGVERRIFDHWVSVMGKNPKTAKLNPARRRKIKARLNEGYSEADLMEAIDHVPWSDWHMGRDPGSSGRIYNDIVTIFRDGAQVEKFMEMMPPKGRSRADGRQTVVDRALDMMDEAGV